MAEGGGIEPDAAVTAPPWVVMAFNDASRGTPSRSERISPEQSGLSFIRVLAAKSQKLLLLSFLRVDLTLTCVVSAPSRFIFAFHRLILIEGNSRRKLRCREWRKSAEIEIKIVRRGDLLKNEETQLDVFSFHALTSSWSVLTE